MTNQDEIGLQRVVADNIRRIRLEKGWSQERVGDRASGVGLSWSRVTVTEIEAGRRPVSLEEFLLLPAVFEGLDIKEFVRSSKPFRVGVFDAEPGDVEYFLRGGEDIHGGESPWGVTFFNEEDLDRMARRETEQNAARSLGVPAIDLSVLAIQLWRHGLTEERDRRSSQIRGEGSVAKRKGHITRALIKELEKKLREKEGQGE